MPSEAGSFGTTNICVSTQTTKQGYINYLDSIDWTFFLTGTTRYSLTLKSARRLMERWYDAIPVPGSILFWVAEPFELKDGHHTHGLLKLPDEMTGERGFRQLIDLWQWATGNKALGNQAGNIEWDKSGWNAINLQTYNPKRGAGGYCSKYVMKTKADYDLLIG